ncbi:MAG: hypothetical protein AVDCRST_MAG79-830, partial [uncultured Thermoleophilia bacterium]
EPDRAAEGRGDRRAREPRGHGRRAGRDRRRGSAGDRPDGPALRAVRRRPARSSGPPAGRARPASV